MTNAQKETLRTELRRPKYAGLDARTISRLLVDPVPIPNPEPVPQIPKPITAAAVNTLLGTITVSEESKAVLVAAVISGDRDQVAAWNELYLDGAAHATVTNYLAQTIADPDHPAEVPGPIRLEQIGLADIEIDGCKYHLGGWQRPYVELWLGGEL